MSYREKVKMYKEGNYRFPVPPVSTSLWSMDDWIRYIDNKGSWT